MSQQANHFKIGVFVIAATVIAFGLCIVLGAGSLLRTGMIMETYVDETVQGLSVGSDVYFRGVKIGRVKNIDFVDTAYDTDKTYIRIVCELDVFDAIEQQNIIDASEKAVKEQGMRVRLNFQALTGGAYLEVDYFPPENNPILEIDWTPIYPRVPSTASTYAKVAKSADELITNLEGVDFGGLLGNLNGSMESIQQGIEDLSLGNLSKEVITTLEELQQTVNSVDAILNKPEIAQMLADGQQAVAGAKAIVQDASDGIGQSVENFASATEKLDTAAAKIDGAAETADKGLAQIKAFLDSQELKAGLKDLASATDNVAAGADGLPDTVDELTQTLKRLDRLITTQQQNIDAILSNVRGISQDIRSMTDYAKRYPSHVLFGDPPKPVETGK